MMSNKIIPRSFFELNKTVRYYFKTETGYDFILKFSSSAFGEQLTSSISNSFEE